MMDYSEVNMSDQNSVDYLQIVLNVAQSKLNDFLVHSLNEEATFIQQLKKVNSINENLKQEIDNLKERIKELEVELTKSKRVLSEERKVKDELSMEVNRKKKPASDNESKSSDDNNGSSKITMKVE